MGFSGFALDVFSPFVINGHGIAGNLKLQVVDSEDRFIDTDRKLRFDTSDYHDRALYIFKINKPATEIKRIRVKSPIGNVYNRTKSGLLLSPKYFVLVYQFNYAYTLTGEDYKLFPGESVRYNLTSEQISALSRPKLLAFPPEHLEINLLPKNRIDSPLRFEN